MGKEYLPQIQTISTVPSPVDVFLAEDFEDSLNWELSFDGDGYIRRDPAQGFTGAYGCVLKSRVTGAAAADWVTMWKSIGHVRGRYVEVFVRFKQKIYDNAGAVSFHLTINTPAGADEYAIRYNPSTHLWYYQDVNQDLVAIADLSMYPRDNQFALLRFVLDLVKRQYVTVDIGSQIASLAGIEPYHPVGYGSELNNYFTIAFVSLTAASVDMAVDNIFIRNIPSP